MASTRHRRRSQKYPEELRERAVRMVFEVRERSCGRRGLITRVALGRGCRAVAELARTAEIDSGRGGGTTSAGAERIAVLEHYVRELR
jgi:transposase